MTDARHLEHRFFDMLMESQYWTEPEMRAYQRNELGHLLRHARSKVPFYRDRLEVLFRSDDSIDWDRWSEVPIVKRADLAALGEEMKATEIPPSHGRPTVSMTSGTTGAPIAVTTTQLANLSLRANRFRAYKWHGIDWRRDMLTVTGVNPREATWPDGSILGAWGPAWDEATIDGQLVRLNRTIAYEKIVEFIGRRKPAYLATTPKVGAAIALEAKRMGSSVPLAGFLARSSAVGKFERDVMLSAFGARTVELYSSKEGGQIAHGCPVTQSLHINAESILVEIVDDHGNPVPNGTSGRVVITPFFNTAQPLIRYDQGDFAISGGHCSCGRHLPVLSEVSGRVTGLFYHPDGRARGGFLRSADREVLNCSDWQFAQTGPHDFEVRYVPIDPSVIGNERAIAERLRDIFFSDARISFVRVQTIEAASNGKPLEYVNEWRPPAT